MTRQVLRDPELQALFQRQGYVQVPMLSAEQVAALLASLRELRPADDWTPDGLGPARNSYHCSFLDDDLAYKAAAFDLLTAAFAHVIEEHLADFRPLSTNFYSKPAGRGRIPVHQNWPVLDDLNGTSVTVWCPLIDVDVANGALHVVPGSHKLLPHIEGPNSRSFFAEFEDQLDDCLVPLPLAAGTGLIFDDSIVHGSPDNVSDASRLAVQITSIPAESSPVFYYRRDDESFELFEADCEFYLVNSVADLAQGRQDWTSRGIVPSRNRALGKREFLSLLGREPPADDAPASRKLNGWVKALLRRLSPAT